MAYKRRPLIATSVVLIFTCMVVVDCNSNPGKLHQLLSVDRFAAAEDAPLLGASAASSDEASIHYEPGIVVETILDGNRLNMSIYSTLVVPFQDFVYAIDSSASQLLKIGLPIDAGRGTDVARRIAGDGRGRSGYIDGWAEDSLFDHPKGMAVDGDGNVYLADVMNGAIRKITPAGYVTTIAGQSNMTGHADGEGRSAIFSSNFDLTYHPSSCSLLIADRGNRRLRKIQLQPQLKCNSEGSVPSGNLWQGVSFFFMFVSAILSAALGKEKCQKRELQRSAAASYTLDDEDELPLIGNPNGEVRDVPLLNNGEVNDVPLLNNGEVSDVPLLANSAATRGRGRSLPSDLMDFSECPSQEREHDRPANRLANSAADSSRDAGNDFGLISSVGEEADGTATGTGLSVGRDVLSDSESTITDPSDYFSRHLHSNSAPMVPVGRGSVEEEINRASSREVHLFSLNSGS